MSLLILKYYSKYILKNLGLIPSETWNNYTGVHVDLITLTSTSVLI